MNTLLVNTTFLKNDIENLLNISLNSPFKKLFTSGNVSFLQSVVSITNTTLEKIYKILTQPNVLENSKHLIHFSYHKPRSYHAIWS